VLAPVLLDVAPPPPIPLDVVPLDVALLDVVPPAPAPLVVAAVLVEPPPDEVLVPVPAPFEHARSRAAAGRERAQVRDA
jgi:hypothetical protein